MDKIYENAVKIPEVLPVMPENQFSMYPRVIGQSARESFTDYSNPRQTEMAVYPGEDIQKAIDRLNSITGGTLYFREGTHLISKNLIGYSGLRMKGDPESTTILDFQEGAYNLSFTGTSVYTTGTITSIASSVNVTGSGTLWLANASAGMQLFIANRWYKIAAVTGDTTLVLSEGYAGNATLPGSAYRIAYPIIDVDFEDLTIQNSGGTSIVGTDFRNWTFKNTTLTSSNVGMLLTNGSETTSDSCIITAHTSDGVQLTNCGFLDLESTTSAGNGRHGWKLTNCETVPITISGASANTVDGVNLTDCKRILLQVAAEGNGEQGIECVSGNSYIFINNGFVRNNTLDGIKLTATSDNVIISGALEISGNGGYGVNVAASTDDNTEIGPGVHFDSNTSGAIQDLGVGTIIR